MSWEHAIVRTFAMSDEIWARHANPWSGWTRVATTPFLFLALWSYVWIGWWALLPVALLLVWLWLNPRVFPTPAHFDHWMSKGVMGERLWTRRAQRPIPERHARAARLITLGSVAFMVPAIYGLIVENFWAALLGFHAAAAMKIWFVDRMVWLYEEMAS